MKESRPLGEIVGSLIDDAEYRTAFTARLGARTVDPAIVERLIAWARARQATKEQAIARKVLSDAGVSWEAL